MISRHQMIRLLKKAKVNRPMEIVAYNVHRRVMDIVNCEVSHLLTIKDQLTMRAIDLLIHWADASVDTIEISYENNHMDIVKAWLMQGRKIDAIKEYRGYTGLALRECKEHVEAIMEEMAQELEQITGEKRRD